jgi:hypothetical protein
MSKIPPDISLPNARAALKDDRSGKPPKGNAIPVLSVFQRDNFMADNYGVVLIHKFEYEYGARTDN